MTGNATACPILGPSKRVSILVATNRTGAISVVIPTGETAPVWTAIHGNARGSVVGVSRPRPPCGAEGMSGLVDLRVVSEEQRHRLVGEHHGVVVQTPTEQP